MSITKEIIVAVKETGLDEVNKKVNKLENSFDSLEDQQRSLSKSMGDSSQSVLDNGGAMGLLNDATGGLAMTVKDAVEASVLFTKSQKVASIQQAIYSTVVGTSTGAMKLFRIALVATGVGALIVGLGLLIANFDKVKKVVLNLIPGLAQVGEFIGNLVEGFTDFIGVTSEAERAMARLTEQADKSLAMNKKFVSEHGDQMNEYTKARVDAKNRYLEAIKEEGADQKALALRLNRELQAITLKHSDDLAKARKERQDKIDDENKKQREKEIEEAKKRDEEKLQKIKDDAQKAYDLDQQAKQSISDVTNFRNDALEAQAEKEDQAGANQLMRMQAEYDEAKKIADDKIRDEELVKQAKFDIANAVFDLVNMFAKKGSKLAKGVAAAQATMNTYQGITAALAAPSTIPEPFGQAVRIANAVSIGAMGLMNVKKILSTNEQGGGGSTPSSSGGSAPQAPSFNLVQGTRSNQIADSISKQAPVKAFVVSKDMTTGQSMDRNIIASASL